MAAGHIKPNQDSTVFHVTPKNVKHCVKLKGTLPTIYIIGYKTIFSTKRHNYFPNRLEINVQYLIFF